MSSFAKLFLVLLLFVPQFSSASIIRSRITDEVRWEDLRFPFTGARPGTASPPGFAQFKDDDSGSTGVYTFRFDKNSEEQMFFEAQMPHKWKEESLVYPHIHWSPIDAGGGSVVWGLECTTSTIGGTFGVTTIITVTDAADGTAFKHQVAVFTPIDMTGITISGILVCRGFRKAADVADDYDNDAVGLELDFHFQVDDRGSHDEWVK